jgi:hypothetical protein
MWGTDKTVHKPVVPGIPAWCWYENVRKLGPTDHTRTHCKALQDRSLQCMISSNYNSAYQCLVHVQVGQAYRTPDVWSVKISNVVHVMQGRVDATKRLPFRPRIPRTIYQRQNEVSEGNVTNNHGIYNTAGYGISDHLRECSMYVNDCKKKSRKHILNHACWSTISEWLRNSWRMSGSEKYLVNQYDQRA